MERDGATQSLWQREEINYTEVNFVHNSKDIFDVIIIGAGITGLTTALCLQAAGKRCMVLEAHKVGFGTTSGTTAHLNTVLDNSYSKIIKNFGLENAIRTAEAADLAIQSIESFIAQYGIACNFTRCAAYLYATEEKEAKELQNMQEAFRQVGINSSYVHHIPGPMKFTKAVCVSGQARFHPTQYIKGLLKAYLELGGKIREKSLVKKVQEEDSFQRVLSADDGVYDAKHIVYATHTPPGIHPLTFKLTPYRSYVIAVELTNRKSYPNDLIYDLKEPFHYIRKAKEGESPVLIIGGEDHKTAHEINTVHNFQKLESFVRQHYSVQRKLYEWSSQFYESADGLPYIGYLSEKKNKFVATGFSGNGMIYGTLSGKIISDIIIKGKSKYQNLFSPSRVKPIAEFQSFVKESADVIKHFVSDRLSVDKLKNTVEIGKGEGRIVKYEGKKIAIYRDKEGELFALNPVCRHAGCIVQWNHAERSWDCPCHGTRYAIDGSLLNGPASTDLPSLKLE